MTDVVSVYSRAVAYFGSRVHAITDDQWHLTTPCTDWDVRDLVNHVTVEDLWAPPLFEGRTIADVGDAFDGDQLGDDPVARWDSAADASVTAAARDGAMTDTVHLSFGDFPGSEYAMQLAADHLIHGWDLAVAIGADATLDPDLRDAIAEWFAPNEGAYRQFGVVGPKPSVADDADAQTRLLAAFGRSIT